jgi:O-antigen/teichoic acid export membrane protein
MEFLAAFILAFLVSLIFAIRDKKGSSFTELIIFFFILFMAGVAGQYWIMPFGPVLYGVAWLPLIFIVLIVTLLFAVPSHKKRKQIKQEEPSDDAASAVVVISIFTWLLLLLLLVSVLIGYSRRSFRNEDISKPPVTFQLLNHGIRSIA